MQQVMPATALLTSSVSYALQHSNVRAKPRLMHVLRKSAMQLNEYINE
jgi:hypothetical protein